MPRATPASGKRPTGRPRTRASLLAARRRGLVVRRHALRWFRRKHGGGDEDSAAFERSLDALDEQTFGQGATEAKRVLHEEYGLDPNAASALLPFIGTQLEAGREPPQGEPAEDQPSN